MTSPILPPQIKVQRLPEHNYLEIITGPPASYISPRHFHEELEIAFKPGGPWDFSYRHQKHLVPPSTIVLTQPGEPHTASSPNTNEGGYFGFRIAADFLTTTTTQLTNHPSNSTLFFPQPLVADPILSNRLLSLHHALQHNQLSPLEQDTFLQDTIRHILNYSDTRLPSLPTYREHAAIQQIKAYLHEHYSENISLIHLAQLTNLSPFHLNHIFRAEVGLPPHLYQTQLRISRAKLLLAQGISPIQAAILTGFSSQSHFGWHFKRLLGITPGQYVRSSNRKQ